MEAKLKSLEIRTAVDCDPDFSYLGYWTDDPPEGSLESGRAFTMEGVCSCRGHFNYFVVAGDPEKIGRDACRKLFERGKTFAEGEWHMMRLWAVATIEVGPNGRRLDQEIRSLGLSGVESDISWCILEVFAREELEGVKEQLEFLGVPTDNFTVLSMKAIALLKEEIGWDERKERMIEEGEVR